MLINRTLQCAPGYDETKYQSKIQDGVKKRGGWCFNVHGGKFQKSGIPDLMIVSPMFLGFIELKIKNKRPEALQYIVMKRIDVAKMTRKFYVMWGRCWTSETGLHHLDLYTPYDEAVGTVIISSDILPELMAVTKGL